MSEEVRCREEFNVWHSLQFGFVPFDEKSHPQSEAYYRAWQAATRHCHEQTAQGDHQPDDISDEEESAWQIINSELAKLNLIGKARTDAADAIWEKIGPFIHEAVDVEKIARMTCEPAWEKLSPEVQQHKLELARDAIEAMGFTPIYTKQESSALPDHIAQAIADSLTLLDQLAKVEFVGNCCGCSKDDGFDKCKELAAEVEKNLRAIQDGGDEQPTRES